MIRNLEELLEESKKKEGIIFAVPCSEDESTIKTVLKAKGEGVADFILVGKKEKIQRNILKNGGINTDFEIINSINEDQSAETVVKLAREKKIHGILKGFLPTASLMKPVLDKETGLRSGNLLSDIMVIDNPRKDNSELLGITDGGLNILPDLKQKKQIIENAVKVFHGLGYSTPKVGILAAVEKVKDSMIATVQARQLTEMNRQGEITGCEVYGPLALDIAVSQKAAEKKGIFNPVAGNAQILVVPNIESGNIFGKSFTYFLKVFVSHVIMGATIPVLIPSRNESEQDKLFSVALGTIIAEK